MNYKLLYVIIIIGVVLVVVINTINKDKTEEKYILELTEHRRKKNIDFQTSEDSPFVDRLDEFTGLKYYPPTIDFNVQARFEKITNKKIRTLSTSDGKVKQYLEYGYVYFVLKDVECKLLILEMVGDGFDGSLFLAFGDLTSAEETYGAGRYLEVEHDGEEVIRLDFNYAYNPYCAYSEAFSCPFPPKENLLDVAIEAGEKNY